jgi:Ssp1 endopeptidase immunity protein Rap1a
MRLEEGSNEAGGAFCSHLFGSTSGARRFYFRHETLAGCGNRDMAGEFFCMAYISGVLDSNPQCGPYTFSLREAMGMVASWLAADPARQKLPGPEVVMSSIRERFPCKSR